MNQVSDEKGVMNLAYRIALTFNDTANNQAYLTYCKKYPLEVIQQAFIQARELPEEKVKKSRSALFFYLVKKYDPET